LNSKHQAIHEVDRPKHLRQISRKQQHSLSHPTQEQFHHLPAIPHYMGSTAVLVVSPIHTFFELPLRRHHYEKRLLSIYSYKKSP